MRGEIVHQYSQPVVAGGSWEPVAGLDIVIVAYRCRDHLERCLASVECWMPAGTHVWVVDNDSRDGTVELVRDTFPSISLIESGENAGFARATNRVSPPEARPTFSPSTLTPRSARTRS